MKMKNVIYLAGIATVLTSLGFLLYGEIDITSFGSINGIALGILYGWYQKIEKEDTVAELSADMKLMAEDHIRELKEYETTVSNLQSRLDLERASQELRVKEFSNKEEVVKKPKRKYTKRKKKSE